MKKTARQFRREAKVCHRRIRASIFAMIVIGVLGLASFYLVKAFSRPAVEPLAGNVIEVAADMSGFDQREIRVRRANQ
jgi:hypothetical protein